jgi:hypothetical protein
LYCRSDAEKCSIRALRRSASHRSPTTRITARDSAAEP